MVATLRGTLDAKTSRKLQTLLPFVALAAAEALLELRDSGYGRLSVIEAERTTDRQAQIYGQGRSVADMRKAHLPVAYAAPAKRRVTKALPSQSLHCMRLALDISINSYPATHWPRIAAAFEKRGFTWGGRFRFRDSCHFEYRGGLSLEQLYSGLRPH